MCAKSWHICDDCLDPLARQLLLFSGRLCIGFDIARYDGLNSEYRQIIELGANAHQKDRLDELIEQMKGQTRPPQALDVEGLYRRYDIQQAFEWFALHVRVDYAREFERRLLAVKRRFENLEFRACQIINGAETSESAILRLRSGD